MKKLLRYYTQKMKNLTLNQKIVWIIAIGFLLRFGYITFCTQLPLGGDTTGTYKPIALSLTHGDGFHDPLRNAPTLRTGPVYPLFLGAVYWLFGEEDYWVRFFQSLISALMIYIVFLTAQKLFMDERISLLASWVTAFYPAFIGYSGILLTETLSAFMTIWFIYCFIIYWKDQSISNSISLGMLAGGLILLRGEMLGVIMIILVISFFYNIKCKTLKNTKLVVLTMLLLLIPWTVRNYRLTHRILPVAAIDGIALWCVAGNNDILEYRNAENEILLSDSLVEIQINNVFRKKSFAEIKKHPYSYFIKNGIRRIARFWLGGHSNAFIWGQISFEQAYYQSSYITLLFKTLLLLINTTLIGLGMYGLVSSMLANPRVLPVIVGIMLVVLGKNFMHYLFYSSNRYHLMLLPILIIFASSIIVQFTKYKIKKLIV